jgi:hypothetical protein
LRPFAIANPRIQQIHRRFFRLNISSEMDSTFSRRAGVITAVDKESYGQDEIIRFRVTPTHANPFFNYICF